MNLQGILPGEHMSLCHAFHLLGGHVASVGNALAEELVPAVYVSLHVAHLLRRERTRQSLEVAVGVGLHNVELQSELVLQQSADIGEHSENAYGAGERCRLCDNPVSRCANIIGSACRHAAHGYYDGLFLLQFRYLVPYLLRRVCGASAGVHA